MVFNSILSSMFMGTIDFLRYLKGFEADEIQLNEFKWSFMHREAKRHKPQDNDDATVVLLHGFSSMKESWMRVAGSIDSRYRVLVPDLPGQGRTTPAEPDMDYSMDEQARRVHDFLVATLEPGKQIHLIGCSMGGMLAGVYAAKYPEQVRTLTMICPAGITMANKSDTLRLLEDTGKNLLLAATADDLFEMNSYISNSDASFPHWIAKLVAKDRARRLPVFQKLLNDSLHNPALLEDYLPRIRANTFVMWGEKDRVLDISCLDVLQKKLQQQIKRVKVFDDCGHTVQQERHAECAEAINEFLASERTVVA